MLKRLRYLSVTVLGPTLPYCYIWNAEGRQGNVGPKKVTER